MNKNDTSAKQHFLRQEVPNLVNLIGSLIIMNYSTKGDIISKTIYIIDQTKPTAGRILHNLTGGYKNIHRAALIDIIPGI